MVREGLFKPEKVFASSVAAFVLFASGSPGNEKHFGLELLGRIALIYAATFRSSLYLIVDAVHLGFLCINWITSPAHDRHLTREASDYYSVLLLAWQR